jgi:predicted Rossmann fold nucleotide-binding protein DprA/Smf involved in DNA uptake
VKYDFLERKDVGGNYRFAPDRSRRDSMNHEEVLAVLPDSKDEAKSITEIAQAMGLEISSYVDWIRAERRLVRALGALTKWGWVACDNRQKEEGHKFWYNAYWKTELAKE